MKKTAILLGATGLTGSLLLKLLLTDERYGTVTLFSRSAVGITHAKLVEHLGDLTDLASFRDSFNGDELFCCIGTTKAKTPDKETYRAIDYGIPLQAARLCKEQGVPSLIVVSAMGADPKSRVFYNRIKGEMERDVLQVHVPKTHFLQPSLIGGRRQERRAGEWFFKQVMKVVDPLLIGSLQKYRSISPDAIAKAMVWLANNKYGQVRIPSDEIKILAEG